MEGWDKAGDCCCSLVSPAKLGGNQSPAERHRARAHDSSRCPRRVPTHGAVDIRECPRLGLVGG